MTSDAAARALHGCQALILAGGSGTRLWPYSRTLLPKQLLALTGTATMLQQTAARALEVFAPADVWWSPTRSSSSRFAGRWPG